MWRTLPGQFFLGEICEKSSSCLTVIWIANLRRLRQQGERMVELLEKDSVHRLIQCKGRLKGICKIEFDS